MGAMDISLHLILAVALLTPMLVVVVAESTLRRRLRSFRGVQLFVLASGLLLIPANIVAVRATEPSQFHVLVVAGTVAALIAQALVFWLHRLPVDRAERPRRILAIGAHPDDLELACGGTLARLADAGHEIHAPIMSDGSVGGDPLHRPGEAYRGASFMRLTECTVLGLPDTLLGGHGIEMVQAIEAKITSLNPDVIFTHSGNDQHQDHSAVHWATMRAGRRHQAILCYESPSVTRDFVPQVFVDIDEYVDAKAAAVAIHHDQSDKPYMNPESLTGIAAFRGSQAKMKRAEGFEAVRIPAFKGVL